MVTMNKQDDRLSKIPLLVIAIFVVTAVIIFVTMMSQFKRTNEVPVGFTQLFVYADSTFMSPLGPGPYLKSEFEKSCGCTVQFVDMASIPLLLRKMENQPELVVDVILGLNYLSLKEVSARLKLQDVKTPDVPFVPAVAERRVKRFVPYNWSPMGIVVSADSAFGKSVLGKPDWTQNEFWALQSGKVLTVPDPNTSTPGLSFLYWITVGAMRSNGAQLSAQKKATEFLDQIEADKIYKTVNQNIHSVMPGWSESYALFSNGAAPAAYTYQTSILYHRFVEKNLNPEFLKFSDGHAIEVEFAAVPENCRNCTTGHNFIRLMLEKESQEKLMKSNFMRPAIMGFENHEWIASLATLKILGPESVDVFAETKSNNLERWNGSRSKR